MLSDDRLTIGGAVHVPVAGRLAFEISGRVTLARANVFACRLESARFGRDDGGDPRMPCPVLLSLLALGMGNEQITPFLELSANWAMRVPVVPIHWKQLIFTLKPGAFSVLKGMDTCYLGTASGRLILQGQMH